MSVKIIDNTVRIQVDNMQGAALALRFMLDDIDRLSTPKTPKDKGPLSRDKLKSVIGLQGKITWAKKYAAPQEAGIIHGSPVRHYTTLGTGPHYAENAVVEVVNNAESYFKKARLV